MASNVRGLTGNKYIPTKSIQYQQRQWGDFKMMHTVVGQSESDVIESDLERTSMQKGYLSKIKLISPM